MKKYKLISTFDGNDMIEIEVENNESPETIALDHLGWFLTTSDEEEE